MAKSKDHTALLIGLGVLAFLVLRDTVQQSLVNAGTAAGQSAGASAVNAAVGDIGTIANDIAHVFGTGS